MGFNSGFGMNTTDPEAKPDAKACTFPRAPSIEVVPTLGHLHKHNDPTNHYV